MHTLRPERHDTRTFRRKPSNQGANAPADCHDQRRFFFLGLQTYRAPYNKWIARISPAADRGPKAPGTGVSPAIVDIGPGFAAKRHGGSLASHRIAQTPPPKTRQIVHTAMANRTKSPQSEEAPNVPSSSRPVFAPPRPRPRAARLQLVRGSGAARAAQAARTAPG